MTSEPRPSASTTAPTPAELFLRPFQDGDAHAIASWIRTPQELTYLAPGTLGPVTAQKVIYWGRERELRFVLCHPDLPLPIGYAELNCMPHRNDQMWIGHFIIDPQLRHQSLGVHFVEALLEQAFNHRAATEVLLVVFPENRAAVCCYERAGMTVQGQERKSFPATGEEHLFLRMGIHVSRYHK